MPANSMHGACGRGDLVEVKRLHARDASLIRARRTNDGRQPMHWACYYGHLEVAQWLHACDASLIRATDNRGWQPMHWACFNGELEVAQWLHACDASLIRATDKGGKHPRDHAAEKRHLTAVTWLDAALANAVSADSSSAPSSPRVKAAIGVALTPTTALSSLPRVQLRTQPPPNASPSSDDSTTGLTGATPPGARLSKLCFLEELEKAERRDAEDQAELEAKLAALEAENAALKVALEAENAARKVDQQRTHAQLTELQKRMSVHEDERQEWELKADNIIGIVGVLAQNVEGLGRSVIQLQQNDKEQRAAINEQDTTLSELQASIAQDAKKREEQTRLLERVLTRAPLAQPLSISSARHDGDDQLPLLRISLQVIEKDEEFMKQLDPDGSIQWRVEGALSDACLRWLLKNGIRQLGHLLVMTHSGRFDVLDELKDAADEATGKQLINPFDHNVLKQYVRHKQSVGDRATQQHGTTPATVIDDAKTRTEMMQQSRLELLKSTTERVHIISTPFHSEQGRPLAKRVADYCEPKNSEHKGVTKGFCYNPNEDCPQTAGVCWLHVWMAICDNTVRTGGKVIVIFRSDGQGKCGCAAKGPGSLDGQAQEGEVTYALSKGCSIHWMDSTDPEAAMLALRKAK